MSGSRMAQDKICVEVMLPHHAEQLASMKAKSNSQDHYDRLRAAFQTDKLWPEGTTIRYGFLGTGNQIPRTSIADLEDARTHGGSVRPLDPLQKKLEGVPVTDAIRRIIKERIQPIVGLKFVYVDNPKHANVRIAFDPDGGAWSLVGTDCLHVKSKPTMNLGWYDVGTVLHEFGHVLGMVHEHQNPKGDDGHPNPIDWNDPKVYAWAAQTQGWDKQTTEKNILSKYANDQINGSEFDPLSMMLYFFPKSLTLNNEGTHQNLRMSGTDVLWINKMYPRSPETPQVFYQKTYGISLPEALAAGKAAHTENSSSGGGISKKMLLIIIGSVVGVIAIGGFAWWFMKRYKRTGGRYGT